MGAVCPWKHGLKIQYNKVHWIADNQGSAQCSLMLLILITKS